MGGNYFFYPGIQKQTTAPAGHKPFYISHYGRHGSRFHYSEDDWVYLNNVMSSADSAQELTEFGKERLEADADTCGLQPPPRGDLTQKGVAQHRVSPSACSGTFRSFPRQREITAYASTSGRCIVSMGVLRRTSESESRS